MNFILNLVGSGFFAALAIFIFLIILNFFYSLLFTIKSIPSLINRPLTLDQRIRYSFWLIYSLLPIVVSILVRK